MGLLSGDCCSLANLRENERIDISEYSATSGVCIGVIQSAVR